MKISIIIPTYKEPEVLDLCLKSCIEGLSDICSLSNIEIIVVVDGFYDLNKEVLKKYKEYINVILFETNQGMVRAINIGVYNASNNHVLICNDDNIFPYDWYNRLPYLNKEDNIMFSINQIEPYPSIFKQFHIKNLGTDVNTFNLNNFWEYEKKLSLESLGYDNNGSTPPIFMNKIDFLKVGGWDESYPGPWVVDWDFFLKCKLCNMVLLRTYDLHMYHFGSIGTKSIKSQELENKCHIYSKYKWGSYIKTNPDDNSKFI